MFVDVSDASVRVRSNNCRKFWIFHIDKQSVRILSQILRPNICIGKKQWSDWALARQATMSTMVKLSVESQDACSNCRQTIIPPALRVCVTQHSQEQIISPEIIYSSNLHSLHLVIFNHLEWLRANREKNDKVTIHKSKRKLKNLHTTQTKTLSCNIIIITKVGIKARCSVDSEIVFSVSPICFARRERDAVSVSAQLNLTFRVFFFF